MRISPSPDKIRFLPRPRWRGFSFALHPTRCRAFILPCYNTAKYKRLQRVLCRPCNYTAHAAKQSTGLYSGFSCGLTYSTAHNTRPAKADITPPVPRWTAYQRPDALHRYQIPAPRRTLHRSAQPQTMQARRGQLLPYAGPLASAAPGAPAEGLARRRSRCFPRPAACNLVPGQRSAQHPPPNGAVQQQGRGGQRGTTGGSRRSSFRAFAR